MDRAFLQKRLDFDTNAFLGIYLFLDGFGTVRDFDSLSRKTA
jgi:hypothetical protein